MICICDTVDRTFSCLLFSLDINGRAIGMTGLDGQSSCMLSGLHEFMHAQIFRFIPPSWAKIRFSNQRGQSHYLI